MINSFGITLITISPISLIKNVTNSLDQQQHYNYEKIQHYQVSQSNLLKTNQNQIFMLADKNRLLYHTFAVFYIHQDNILR